MKKLGSDFIMFYLKISEHYACYMHMFSTML